MAERDVARMVEEALADSEAQLREQVRAFREITVAAFHKFREMDQKIQRQHATIVMLRRELRDRMGERRAAA